MSPRPRVLLAVLLASAAVSAAGAAAPAGTALRGDAHAAEAAIRSTPSPGPAVETPPPTPWFDMALAHWAPGFWEPAAPPAGAPPTQAKAGILVDLDTGEILWELQPHLALPPASTTKVLAALIALENLNLDQEVTVTPDALGQAPDDTVMGLKPGETLSVEELLEGMLLPSGDDAASAIAVDTVGEARFVAAMNAQVEDLGLADSHFTNTAGLDDPGLYASAYDLAAIADYTYRQYPIFDSIVDTRSMVLPASELHPAFYLTSVDALLRDYPAAVGIKPGWTGDAGACLIGMAVRDGHSLLAVLMNGDYPSREEGRLFDWGFAVEDGLPPLLPPTPTPKPSPAVRS